MRHGDSKVALDHCVHIVADADRKESEKLSVKIGRSMAQLESTHSKTAGKYGTWRKRMGVEIAESLPKSTSSTALLPLKNDLLPNGAKLPSHVLRQ
jgi:hypothetical protein